MLKRGRNGCCGDPVVESVSEELVCGGRGVTEAGVGETARSRSAVWIGSGKGVCDVRRSDGGKEKRPVRDE